MVGKFAMKEKKFSGRLFSLYLLYMTELHFTHRAILIFYDSRMNRSNYNELGL